MFTRFVRTPCCRQSYAGVMFHCLMINLTVDQGRFSKWDIFLYPLSNLCFSVTYLWSSLECFFDFVVELFPDTDAPVTEPFRLRCIYTTVLQTHSLHHWCLSWFIFFKINSFICSFFSSIITRRRYHKLSLWKQTPGTCECLETSVRRSTLRQLTTDALVTLTPASAA